MIGKTLIAAGAVIALLSGSAASAEPVVKPLSNATVSKIQDLSRARAQMNYRKKSHAVDAATAAVIGIGGGAAIGFGVGEATKSTTII